MSWFIMQGWLAYIPVSNKMNRCLGVSKGQEQHVVGFISFFIYSASDYSNIKVLSQGFSFTWV